MILCTALASGLIPASAPAQGLPSASRRAVFAVASTSGRVGAAGGIVYTVVIDAGHQARQNLSPDPIGPHSKKTKPAVASGASGVVTHHPEYAINLQVALRLRTELVKRGVRVVMIRTTNNVNIPNSKRARIANAAHPDLVIHIHCDGIANRSVHGFSTLYPAVNGWTRRIAAASKRAARLLQSASVKATGAASRGTVARGDLTGFNWSTVPTTMVEMGFLSNPGEDRRLGTASYQTRLASGLADGIMQFLKK